MSEATETPTAPVLPPPVTIGHNLDKKETVGGYTFLVIRDGEIRNPLTVRFYMGRSSSASVVYCRFWLSGPGGLWAANGSASGYGYHKESAAFQAALDAAGIKLARPIDGVGSAAIRDAGRDLLAVLGWDVSTLTVL